MMARDDMIKQLLVLGIFPGTMALTALTDLLFMRVPISLVFALTVGFFILAPLVGLGLGDIATHVATAFAALTLCLALFSLGWIGGGDVKLFAASCLWFGPHDTIAYSVLVAVIGMSLTILILFWRGLPLPSTLASQGWVIRLHNPKEGVPYGIALAAAGLLVYPSTPFMAALGN
jgi:prepilin peptidase CpaA